MSILTIAERTQPLFPASDRKIGCATAQLITKLHTGEIQSESISEKQHIYLFVH